MLPSLTLLWCVGVVQVCDDFGVVRRWPYHPVSHPRVTPSLVHMHTHVPLFRPYCWAHSVYTSRQLVRKHEGGKDPLSVSLRSGQVGGEGQVGLAGNKPCLLRCHVVVPLNSGCRNQLHRIVTSWVDRHRGGNVNKGYIRANQQFSMGNGYLPAILLEAHTVAPQTSKTQLCHL